MPSPAPPATPPLKPRAPEVAVAPLDTLVPEDVAAGSAAFDRWLRKLSDNYVTLERLSSVASALPVIGNVMALIDAIGDIVSLVDKFTGGQPIGFEDWASLGIDLIGVIPAPPTMAAARMSLRPALYLVKQKKMLAAAAGGLGEALVEVIVAHLNEALAGEIQTFVDQASKLLGQLLDSCAKQTDGIADDLIDVLRRCIGDKPLFDVAWPVVAETALHDPKVQSSWRRMLGALAQLEKRGANAVAGALAQRLPPAARATVLAVIGGLTDLKAQFRASLLRLADEQAEKSIRWLLKRLIEAVAKHRVHSKSLSEHGGAKHTGEKPGHGMEVAKDQVPPKGDPNACKLCPLPAATPGSISFATGSETLSHVDFVLSAPLPIEWSRTYRSPLAAYDQGSLGARWLTPYSLRIDVEGGALVYRAADGRSHRFPWLEVGQSHHDPVEELTLSRVSDKLLTLDAGKPLPAGEPSAWRETYERVQTCAGKQATQGREHFRLGALSARDGASIGLRYDHRIDDGPCAGEAVLSDILSRQGETLIAHAGTRIDPQSGRILALWEIQAGELLRQLAAYAYDEHGDLVEAQDENAASWHYEYGRDGPASDHLISRYTDRTGRGMNLLYDGHGPGAKAVREWADDGSLDTRLVWDPRIRLTTLVDALGQESAVYYDVLGYPYRLIHPDGNEEWFFRDAAKNLTRHVHPDGSSDNYRYDLHGHLITQVRGDGSTLHFEYDAAHRLTGILDPDGGVWRRDHDMQGRLVEQTDPLGHVTQYAHDPAGRPVRITDAKGGVATLAYAPDGQLVRYTDCSGSTRRWEYDARGRLVKSIDAAGQATTYRYTPVSAEALARAQGGEGNHPGQLEAVTLPDESQELLRHDAEGRLLAHTDALQRRTTYRYGPSGRISERIDALGHRLGYRWDALGRLSELRNQNDRPYRFEYDPVGRLLRETGFDGRSTDYRYAPGTGVLAEVVEGEVHTKLAFDALGRLTERSASVPGQDDAAESFAYTAGGRLAEARNRDARLQWFYDPAGNLVREHQHYQGESFAERRTAVWRHDYDELNQRVATLRPDGHRLAWLTYGAGHVHGLVLDGQEVVGFERDALYREVLRTQRNGLAQHQRYDAAGRLVEQRLASRHYQGLTEMGTGAFQYEPYRQGVPQGPAAVLRRYRYDAAGQLQSIGDSRRGQFDYRYDPLGQLLQADSALAKERFAFDPAGNRVTPPAQGSVREPALPRVLDNLLKEYAGTHYVYDARGNLVEQRHNARRSRFEWDGFGRLRRALTPQGTTTYAYDPLGRRIAKRHRAAAASGAQETMRDTLYGWDGDTLAFESSGDAQRGATVHYVYEPDGFVPLLQARRRGAIALAPTTDVKGLMAGNGGRYDIDLDPLWNGAFDTVVEPFGDREINYYQCDQLGTPQELTDHEGQFAWAAQYKAWGEAKEAVSAAARKAGITNPIRFQGQYFDEETGLHYNRYRYYDPVSGRFVSKDPIGLAGGVHLYQYASNPTGWVDPLGLSARTKSTRKRRGDDAESIRCECLRACRSVPGTTTVIGRVRDLGSLNVGEESLLLRLPYAGSPRANMKQNFGVLRAEMGRGEPIRDASPHDHTGEFLNAERDLLSARGWKFDKETSYWMPPANWEVRCKP